MTEPTAAETPAATPSSLLSEALHNPLALVARRAELARLASERANALAAEARTRVEGARADASAKVQDLRKASDALVAGAREQVRAALPARLRRVAREQLLRAAGALESLAKAVEPVEPAVEPAAPADMPAPEAEA